MFRDNDDVQVTPVASTSKRVRSVACNTEGVRALIDRADPVHAGVLPLRSLGVSQRIVDDFVVQSEVQVSAARVAADHVTGCHNIRSLGHRHFLRDQRLISGELSRTATALIRDLIRDNLLPFACGLGGLFRGLLLLCLLAQVITGRDVAVVVVKAHVIRIHIRNVQVAVGVVVAVRLVVLRITQPPLASVGRLPSSLLAHSTLHGVLVATTTLVCGTSHVNNQVRLPRVVVVALLHRVVHDGPVILVARRPDLVASGARVLFSALLHLFTTSHLEDVIPGGILGGVDLGNFAAGCTDGCALHCRRGLLHFGLGVVAVVPVFAAASSLATGNRLALGTLEALQTVRALRVRVALASAALQILGTAAVSAAQVLDAAVQRIVAVVPIFAASISFASH